MNEQQLLEQLGGLPREREPGRDLWPEIHQRIAPVAASIVQRRPWLTAVAAALLVGVSLTLGARLGSEVSKEGVANPGDSVALGRGTNTAGNFYASLLDLEYAGAMRDVAGQFKAAPQVAPDHEDVALTQSLKILQQATQDLRGALEKDPNSIFLADLLASTHRKRMNLLRDLALARVDTIKTNTRKT